MKHPSHPHFFSSKKFMAILFLCLSFMAVNVRADDDLYTSPDDLSSADKKAAQSLQQQMDEDARQKEIRERGAHVSGDDVGMIFVSLTFAGIVGLLLYNVVKGMNGQK
jgi:hypothetical protein